MSVIAYDKKVYDFIPGLNRTGHVTHRSYKKKSVTLHHNGGRLSLQGILDVWKVRPASAHFQVDRQARVGQYVLWHEYAWATGNTRGNQESISIEMANETTAPSWRVHPDTWKEAARLAGWLFANVIDGRPRPSRSNLFYHKHWKATDCAGPYMDTVYNQVLAEAQKWYDYFRNGSKPPVDTEEKELMTAKDEILEYVEACAIQIQNNTKQLLNAAVEALKENQQVMAVAVNNFVRQTDAGSDSERRAELDAAMAKAQANFDRKLDELKNATLSTPKPGDSVQPQ
ncbi:MAG TPA: peptidoglycan recognition family protein [Pyrinomonadaceae bacterium]|nr:peptidoglycan recognition family protein [Pyrinomonadaceae bacterium]